MSFIPQVFIMIFGVSAVWLVGRRTPKVRRWGYVCGLCAQPFWLWTTVAHEQWGIAAMCAFYAWFEQALGREHITEVTIDERLTAERAKREAEERAKESDD